jgi:hypothetical protein
MTRHPMVMGNEQFSSGLRPRAVADIQGVLFDKDATVKMRDPLIFRHPLDDLLILLDPAPPAASRSLPFCILF